MRGGQRLILAWLALGIVGGMMLIAGGKSAREEKPGGSLRVGFNQVDITPPVGPEHPPVYIAGFGQNRIATGVHDPLHAQAIVLDDGTRRVALASVDLIGLFYPNVLRIRAALPGFDYVMVNSTHNHEGPDTLGLWGPSPVTSGVDQKYLEAVEQRVVEAVRQAASRLQPAVAEWGTVTAPELLHDAREPYIKHDALALIRFRHAESKKPLGILVNWHCHPETLDSKNTLLTADYVGFFNKQLAQQQQCPVAYYTGTVGGLLTSLNVPLKNAEGEELADGTFEKAEVYAQALAAHAQRALAKAQPITLTPLSARSRVVYVPLANPLYHMARTLGVLRREAFAWIGDPERVAPLPAQGTPQTLALQTEVAVLQFGAVKAVCVPGEIYPELVLGQVQTPVDPGADFPEAPAEPALLPSLGTPYTLLFGLANDELGYIIPKRQWDEKPPYCYQRKKSQYGEQNSVGPETAPILCRALVDLARQP